MTENLFNNLNMVCDYKVEEAKVSKDLCFRYPGSDKTYMSYSICQRHAFETFCHEYMKYDDNKDNDDRHPILECLDHMDSSYNNLSRPKQGDDEPVFWCPACNWKG